MPRDSGGVYTLPVGYLAVTGTVIQAAQHNNPLEDIAGGLTGSLPRNGSAGMLADLPMGAKKITGMADGMAASHAVTKAQLDLQGPDAVQTLTNKTLVTPTINDSATIRATNDGATGALLITQHISASPAASDIIAAWNVQGKDSAGNTDIYGQLRHFITDPTSASEDSAWDFWSRVAGALAQRLQVGAGMFMTGATGGDPGAGKINAIEYQVNGTKLHPLTSGTVVASTSGTSIDFTGIPAGVKKIIIAWAGLSTSGTAVPLVQLGDTGGIEATGYLGAAVNLNGADADSSNFTTGFGLSGEHTAANILHGSMTLVLIDASTNTWAASTSGGMSNTDESITGGGSKSLSAVLDRVRLTTTDTFDAGKVNILYE